MRSRSRGPRISSARPADQTAQVSTRPSRRRRARVSRRLAPRGLVRTPASFRRDISSCTSGAPSNSRGNCAPAAVGDASGSASSLRSKPCRPAPTPRAAGVSNATRSARGVRATSRRVAQTCVQETGCGTSAWPDFFTACSSSFQSPLAPDASTWNRLDPLNDFGQSRKLSSRVFIACFLGGRWFEACLDDGNARLLTIILVLLRPW